MVGTSSSTSSKNVVSLINEGLNVYVSEVRCQLVIVINIMLLRIYLGWFKFDTNEFACAKFKRTPP